MQNLSRLIVGIVAIPIVVAIIFFLPIGFFITLIMLVTGVGLFEYFNLIPDSASAGLGTVSRVFFACMGAALPVFSYYWALSGMVGWLYITLAALMLFTMGSLPHYERALSMVAGGVLGFFFVAFSMSLTIPVILMKPYGHGLILWLAFVVWGGDTGAFYLGSRFGKHKLYPRVSPKKSVEGILGGMLSALLIGVIANLFIRTGLEALEALILPPLLVLLGQLGDFCESMLKRGAGVKDSGKLLAGHGGILDRIDSFLFAIPFFYLYLHLRP